MMQIYPSDDDFYKVTRKLFIVKCNYIIVSGCNVFIN